MHLSATLNLFAITAAAFFESSSAWSFTMFNDVGCGNSTAISASDTVEYPGDVTCSPVPHADQHKSILGKIPAGNCTVLFYPSEGCGDRVAFSLTQYTSTCLFFGDFDAPLAFYRATGCE
ncbi:hypothetical protein F5Y02DRAFT_298513 [Annulohypoxylon stygium]|nr:hypothetical protein F5Y02DRAFT_298513 [Annulohypoxylon stygium]